MSSISYQVSKQVLNQKAVIELYNSVGWSSYTKHPNKLWEGIMQSQLVYTAWETSHSTINKNSPPPPKLVGLIRTISDNNTIVYIQDILVHPNCQRQGIGTHLLMHVKQHYQQVRQMVLLTDDTPKNKEFYESLGFTACNNGRLLAFAHIKQS